MCICICILLIMVQDVAESLEQARDIVCVAVQTVNVPLSAIFV